MRGDKCVDNTSTTLQYYIFSHSQAVRLASLENASSSTICQVDSDKVMLCCISNLLPASSRRIARAKFVMIVTFYLSRNNHNKPQQQPASHSLPTYK